MGIRNIKIKLLPLILRVTTTIPRRPIKVQARQPQEQTDQEVTELQPSRKIEIETCQRRRRPSLPLRMETQMQTGPSVTMLLVSNLKQNGVYITDIKPKRFNDSRTSILHYLISIFKIWTTVANLCHFETWLLHCFSSNFSWIKYEMTKKLLSQNEMQYGAVLDQQQYKTSFILQTNLNWYIQFLICF